MNGKVQEYSPKQKKNHLITAAQDIFAYALAMNQGLSQQIFLDACRTEAAAFGKTVIH